MGYKRQQDHASVGTNMFTKQQKSKWLMPMEKESLVGLKPQSFSCFSQKYW
jgi:hypothetical protein